MEIQPFNGWCGGIRLIEGAVRGQLARTLIVEAGHRGIPIVQERRLIRRGPTVVEVLVSATSETHLEPTTCRWRPIHFTEPYVHAVIHFVQSDLEVDQTFIEAVVVAEILPLDHADAVGRCPHRGDPELRSGAVHLTLILLAQGGIGHPRDAVALVWFDRSGIVGVRKRPTARMVTGEDVHGLIPVLRLPEADPTTMRDADPVENLPIVNEFEADGITRPDRRIEISRIGQRTIRFRRIDVGPEIMQRREENRGAEHETSISSGDLRVGTDRLREGVRAYLSLYRTGQYHRSEHQQPSHAGKQRTVRMCHERFASVLRA